jgi:signal transduction histidine kinase/ligand-binding sensor domain-containing protein
MLPLAFGIDAGERTLSELEHTRWTLADGAPGQIGAISQTADGYLWLASGASLYRFDGVRFVRYVHQSGYTPGVVSSLLGDANGQLWVGFARSGIALIRPDGLRHFSTADGLPGGIVYGLASDSAGGIWAATGEGLARWDGSRWQSGVMFGLTASNVHAIFVARDNTVWASADGRVLRLSPDSDRFDEISVAVGWIARFAQAPDGSLWIAERDDGPVRPIVAPNGALIDTQRNGKVGATGLVFDRSGALWFSTRGNGIHRIARPHDLLAPGTTEKFTAQVGLTADYATTLFEDRTGIVWVGTSAGLDRFRTSPLVRAALPSETYNLALAAGGDGSIWIGSANRPVMRLHERTLTTEAMPPPVGVAHADRDGMVWMGGPAGIWRSANDKLEKVTELPVPASPDLRVRVLVHDPADRLWVAIERHGLFQYHDAKWIAVAAPTQNPLHAIPVVGSVDPQGRVWLGYRDNLLMRIDADGTMRRWTPEEGMDIGHVTSIAHGKIRTWIGGLSGLAYLQNDRVVRVRISNSEDVSGVHGLIEADNGELWAHANAGLLRFSADEIARAVTEPNSPVTAHLIRGISLLTEDPVTIRPLPTAIADQQGRLWLSTNRGAVWLDSVQLEATSSAPAAHVEMLVVDGVSYPIDGSTTLPARPARVTFRFTALDTHAPEQVRFRYRLDGYDDNWQETGTMRQATYTGLAPGEYRIQIAAANANGPWSDVPASAAFHVRPAFDQTKTFLALCAAAIALLLWTLYRIRLRIVAARLKFALEERHTERERIARELHDTLLQGFHSLQLRFHSAAMGLEASVPARASIERALDQADEVLTETRDRVTELRTRNIIDLPETLRMVGQSLVTERGVQFLFRQEGQASHLGPFVSEEIYLIAREALMNALQHAKPEHIEMVLEQGRRKFRLLVRDDGCGLPDDILMHGVRSGHWGIPGMRERARRIRARLHIRRRTEGGTEVELNASMSVLARYEPSL